MKSFYIPDVEVSDINIDLVSEYEEIIDPITYEVVRHRLWNINEEHGATITTVAASPAVLYAQDISPCLLTAKGEFVFFGPYIQFFGGMTDLPVKWILQHRSENPGIHDGDMFLCNDPLIGTHHQSDVYVICPIFWEEELICWSANALHHYDLGGNTPGSFCIDAADIYDEPVPIPPIKIVEHGNIRDDVAEMFVRHSRAPEIVNLDLRAQIAGNNVARERINELLTRYGPGLVSGVMEKIISDAERVFVAKLRQIPDGEWQARGYMEAAFPADRDLHPACMTLRKSDDRLVFSNAGTAGQIGTLNTTYAGWRGAIMAVLNPFMCHDMMYAIGGAFRHLEFDAEPGTMLSVVHPGATSCSAAFGTQMAIDLAHQCIARMLGTAPALSEAVAAAGGHSQTGVVTLWGTDQRGRPYGTILLDHMIGSLGGFNGRDGISTGGLYWIPHGLAPNVEFNERHYPILYLFRREAEDSGGAGKFRGGNSAMAGFVPHRTEIINQVLIGAGIAVPGSPGLNGGFPGCPTEYRIIRGSNVRELLDAGFMPAMDEILGQTEFPAAKTRPTLTEDDVFVVTWTASGGYGDPLERAPQAVSDDVQLGVVSAEAARRIYGVALTPNGVDAEGTDALREVERSRRLALAGETRATLSSSRDAVIAHLSPEIGVVWTEEGARSCCLACGTRLGPLTENVKDHCIDETHTLADGNARTGDPARFTDETLELRCSYCPGCGRQLVCDVARVGDEPLWDSRLDDSAIAAIEAQ
jgi:N-methylhydantoinase B